MANAKRDDNRVPTLLAVSNADGSTPVVLWADPTTHRLLTSGDITAPASSTDNAIPRWDGTDGSALQDSGVIIDDSDNITGINDLTVLGDLIFGDATTDTLTVNGELLVTPIAVTSGTPNEAIQITGAAHTNVADANVVGALLDFSATVNFVDITTDQTAARILAPTYSSDDGGGDTIAQASTLFIDKAPVGGTNVTITEALAINAAADTDAGFIFGRTRIHSASADVAQFSHFDIAAASGVALAQTTAGATFLGAPAGQTVNIRVNTVSVLDVQGAAIIAVQPITLQIDNIGETSADADLGMEIISTTAATVGVQEYSPMLVFEGQGWKTDAVAASQEVQFGMQVIPVQGAATPTGALHFFENINDGGFNSLMSLNSAGQLLLANTGDAVNPAIVAPDTDTGFFFAANTVAITTNGILRFSQSTSALTMSTPVVPSAESLKDLGSTVRGWLNIFQTRNAIGAVSTDSALGYLMNNTTAAAAGAQQYSPMHVFEGQGWKTDATAETQEVQFGLQVIPIEGTANPTGALHFFENINDGGFNSIMNLGSDGKLTLTGRLLGKQGTDVASATNLTLPADGNTFELTGTTKVDLISNLGWQNGSRIKLVANESVTIDHGTATASTNVTIRLAGSADFAMTAESSIILELVETTAGGQVWLEESRTVI